MGNQEKSQNYEIILFSCAKIRIFVNYCAKVSSIFFQKEGFSLPQMARNLQYLQG